MQITIYNPLVKCVVGREHQCAIDSKGDVHCWGKNSQGECNVPLEQKNAKDIAVIEDQTVVIKEDGSLLQWGSKYSYNGMPSGNNFIKISGKYRTFAQLKDDGTIYVFGYGRDYTDFKDIPIPTDNDFVDIECGYTLAIQKKSDGTLKIFGYDDPYGSYDRLMNFMNTTSENIVKISSQGSYQNQFLTSDNKGIYLNHENNIKIINDVKDITCGSNTAIFLKTDNTIEIVNTNLSSFIFNNHYLNFQELGRTYNAQITMDGKFESFLINITELHTIYINRPNFDFKRIILKYLNDLYTISDDVLTQFDDNVINDSKFNLGFSDITNINNQKQNFNNGFNILLKYNSIPNPINKKINIYKKIIKINDINIDNFNRIKYLRLYLNELSNLYNFKLFFKKDNQFMSVIGNKLISINFNDIENEKDKLLNIFEFNNLSEDMLFKLQYNNKISIYSYINGNHKINNISLKGDYLGKYVDQTNEQQNREIQNDKIKIKLFENTNYRIKIFK